MNSIVYTISLSVVEIKTIHVVYINKARKTTLKLPWTGFNPAATRCLYRLVLPTCTCTV